MDINGSINLHDKYVETAVVSFSQLADTYCHFLFSPDNSAIIKLTGEHHKNVNLYVLIARLQTVSGSQMLPLVARSVEDAGCV